MPRTGRRRSLTIAAAVVAMLAAPAAAQAATYTVKPNEGTCGGPDLLCGDLAEAASAAIPGDVFNVEPGLYGSATFNTGGVTITGAPNFAVNGNLTFDGDTGGVSKLQKAAIAQPNGVAPAVTVSGTTGLEISDSAISSANDNAIEIAESANNKIVRSLISTGGASTAAVHMTSADTSTATKKLTMESSIITGGAAGLKVDTGSGGPFTAAGDVEVKLRHVTAAGSSNALAYDGTKAIVLVGGPFGNLTADVADSILQNGFSKDFYAGVILLAPPNTVTDTYTRTLQSFDPNAVFVNPATRNFRLKAGSPAIGAGGVTPGESATDIEGNDRSTAPTDQGADEFVAPPTTTTPPPGPPAVTNDGAPPTVKITKPKANQKIKISTTKTKTVTRNGKRVKRKTTKRTKISFAGTATDPSGIKAVGLFIEKINLTGTPTVPAAGAKCKYFNAKKGIVVKSCAKPILHVARLGANGAWTFSVKTTVKLGAGRYRVVVFGADGSGAFGNSATPAEAVRLFTLTR